MVGFLSWFAVLVVWLFLTEIEVGRLGDPSLPVILNLADELATKRHKEPQKGRFAYESYFEEYSPSRRVPQRGIISSIFFRFCAFWVTAQGAS